MVVVRYTGYVGQGAPFLRDEVAAFVVGRRRVMPGLDQGIEGMRAGGKRRLRVAPHLVSGVRGMPGRVPPNTPLVFDVELLEVRDPE